MSAKIYFLNFEGYWRENEISTIPNYSGVYCVYTCGYQSERNQVSLRSLIYVKGAEDVGASIAESENWPDWRKHLREGEELCFSLAAVEPSELPRVDAGLISTPHNCDQQVWTKLASRRLVHSQDIA